MSLKTILKRPRFSNFFLTKVDGYVDGITKEAFKDDALKYKESVKDILNDCKKLIQHFSEAKKQAEKNKSNKDDNSQKGD